MTAVRHSQFDSSARKSRLHGIFFAQSDSLGSFCVCRCKTSPNILLFRQQADNTILQKNETIHC